MGKIAVLGSGVMGHGIAQVFAMNGFDVILCDLHKEALDQARKAIETSLMKLSAKQGNVSVAEAVNRIMFTTDRDNLKNARLVIEAVTEKIDLKKEIFSELDQICAQNTILASNTSSLSIAEMANATNRPDRVCGLHFFNPPPLMDLVEISATEKTSEETLAFVENLVARIGKESIRVKDTPLFVVNRLLVPMICEAISIVEEGTASVEDVDKAMKLGAHHPIGPLWLADMIGLDTLLHIQQARYEETKDSKFHVPNLLKKMVAEGKLGRKSGEGFYQYKKEAAR